MKSLFPRPIFTVSLFTNPKYSCFQIAHFSTSFQNQAQNSYPSRRHEEESRTVKVSVWWDFENCSPPAGFNVFKIAQSITAAVRANGIKGPVQITAFGDVMQLSRMNQEALSSTGVNLAHVPNGGKNSADRSLLVDLMYWVSQNPPPAHLFLISGDRDFAGILHKLRMNNYNILLASPGTAPSVLCSAASIMWQWNALLKGENLVGKHFNQPPDGPYGSWYGHYKAPLEDPFAVTEPPPSPRSEGLSEAVADPKPRPVPRPIMKQIRNILNMYPKGIYVTEFRAELAKSNLNIDKDYYGNKKFLRFLLAMPSILKLQFVGDGKYLVRSVTPKVPEQSDSFATSPERETNGEAEFASTPIINGETGSCMQGKDEKSLLPQVKTSPRKLQGPQTVQEVSTEVQQPPTPAKGQEPTTKMHEPLGKTQEVSPIAEDVVAKGSKDQLQIAEYHGSAHEMGFLKRFWSRWFGNKETTYGENILNEKAKTASREVELRIHSEQLEGPVSSVLANNASTKDEAPMQSEDTIEKPSQESSLFNKIKNWCRSWRSSKLSDESCSESHKESKQTELCPVAEDVFSKESFWRELGSFIIAGHGSVLVLQSRTRSGLHQTLRKSRRAQMARNLREEGPSLVSSLSEHDVLRVVDLLISDKKWVEECPSRTFPFKLHRPAVNASLNSNSSTSNGLSSMFRSTKDGSNSQNSQKIDGEKRHQNPPQAGVSQSVVPDTCFGKSRNEVLVDCRKLVEDIAKNYPEGYNMGSFRFLFEERYGYPLNVNKLGYTKLVNLLQIMPGIKIEDAHIFPSAKVLKSPCVKTDDSSDQESDLSGSEANLGSESSNIPEKCNELDSPWEELGPVSKAEPLKNETKLGSKKNVKDESSDYEAPSDGDFSDSDEETTPRSTKSKNGKSKKVREEDSSLLQILDSWYAKKDASESVDGTVDCYTDGSKPSSLLPDDTTEISRVGRRQKTYSFVTDQPGDATKDKLIDGILGSLKKSGGRSTESTV